MSDRQHFVAVVLTLLPTIALWAYIFWLGASRA